MSFNWIVNRAKPGGGSILLVRGEVTRAIKWRSTRKSYHQPPRAVCYMLSSTGLPICFMRLPQTVLNDALQMWRRGLMTEDKNKPNAGQIAARFAPIVQVFAKERSVNYGGTTGFGSGALRVNGKIFAMISSRGEFVVKLPKERVDEFVINRTGERFDPGHGRRMKEWLVVKRRGAAWRNFAKEACELVKARHPD